MDGGMYYGSSGKRPHLDDDGGDRGNGRYKKRSNLNEDQLALALPQDTEYRLLCPGSKIGSLIGKGGSVIKALRTECKSKIKVEDPVAGSDERVVLISSSSDQLKEGSSYASSDSWSDQLKGGSSYVCNAQEAVFKVHARINEVEEEEDPVSVRLLVPKSHIGCLLGKGGKIIEQMRKDFGAQIRILPKEQHPPCAAPADELVQVSMDYLLSSESIACISSCWQI
jgi:poly(rC)-binding protein 2/3/4